MKVVHVTINKSDEGFYATGSGFAFGAPTVQGAIDMALSNVARKKGDHQVMVTMPADVLSNHYRFNTVADA
jgi:hypothetical protein